MTIALICAAVNVVLLLGLRTKHALAFGLAEAIIFWIGF